MVCHLPCPPLSSATECAYLIIGHFILQTIFYNEFQVFQIFRMLYMYLRPEELKFVIILKIIYFSLYSFWTRSKQVIGCMRGSKIFYRLIRYYLTIFPIKTEKLIILLHGLLILKGKFFFI